MSFERHGAKSTRALSFLIGCFLAILLATAACSDDDDGSDNRSAAAGSPSYLYVIDAASGTSDSDTLTLSGVDDNVLRFTDRPNRQVAYLSLDDFVQE